MVITNPKSAKAWCIRGMYYNNAFSQYGKALKSYDNGLERDPENRLYWYAKEITLQNMKKFDETEVCIKNAKKINPTVPFRKYGTAEVKTISFFFKYPDSNHGKKKISGIVYGVRPPDKDPLWFQLRSVSSQPNSNFQYRHSVSFPLRILINSLRPAKRSPLLFLHFPGNTALTN
jgi:tetratricopeptide (TPR) repeat protein